MRTAIKVGKSVGYIDGYVVIKDVTYAIVIIPNVGIFERLISDIEVLTLGQQKDLNKLFFG